MRPNDVTRLKTEQGRAETVRLALTLGKVPFEDHRLKSGEWADFKAKTPYGAAPVMTVDGEMVAQSNAMLRYAGRLSGLYPKDALKAALADEVIDLTTDLMMCGYRYRGDDKDKLKEEREKLVTVDVPRYWGGLESRLESMGAGEYALGDKLSVADIAIFTMYTTIKCGLMEFIETDVLDSYPKLFKIFNTFSALPEVVAWYKKHPIPKLTIG